MNFVKNIIVGSLVFTCLAAQSVHAEELSERLADYFNTRDEAAFRQIFEQPDLFDPATGAVTFDIYNAGNGDEKDVANFASSYTKGFEHDAITGLVTMQGAASFNQLVKALKSGAQDDFNAIQLASTRKLVGPQGALCMSLQGRPSQLFQGFKPPKLTSAQAAADMIEIYLMAICRHVHFDDYGTGMNTDADGIGGSLTQRVSDILNSLGSAFTGPRDSSTGTITPNVLFRGNTPGNLYGYHVSQFFLQNVPALFSKDMIANTIKYPIVVRKASMREFGVTWDDFVKIENGLTPRNYISGDFGMTEHLVAGRDLATIVHNDGPIELFYNATQILFGYGFPLSKDLPYQDGSITKEAAFTSLGIPEVYAALGIVAGEALKVAWAQKWLAHRSLRPEAFGGLVHLAKTTGNNQFGLHSSVLDDVVLNWVKEHNQKQNGIDGVTIADASTYLLSQMYPEASPTHPSFPAGHAVIAGACTTVLKAYFEGSVRVDSKLTLVKPDSTNPGTLIADNPADANLITVNSELDKLASNVANGRNFAGIHYRADGDRGCELGELTAIYWLQDQARIHTEKTFKGFTLTKRNGTKIRIGKDAITVIT